MKKHNPFQNKLTQFTYDHNPFQNHFTNVRKSADELSRLLDKMVPKNNQNKKDEKK